MDPQQPCAAEEPEDHLGMTPEQWAIFRRLTSGHGEQDEFGIDLSLIRQNLKLTPLERLRKLQRATNSLGRLRDAAIRSGL